MFKDHTKVLFINAFCLSIAGCSGTNVPATEAQKPNILFIGIDDLRVQLRSYGFPEMHTPNFDRLAEMGMQFNRAYVQQSICAASRASLLTGCRPVTTGVDYPYTDWFNNVFRAEFPTIVDFFHDNGYYTRSLGKIHHGPVDQRVTEPHYRPTIQEYRLPENQLKGNKLEFRSRVQPFESADFPDSDYIDGMVALETIATIRRAVKQGKPFFIAPGFVKPHLPFVCPKKYFDLYDLDEIPLAEVGYPEDYPDFIFRPDKGIPWGEYYEGTFTADYTPEQQKKLIQAYNACVSFIDAQIGLILDEIEELGLLENTIILVWSDHGFHLGDHGNWKKATNFEWSNRSPTFIYVPGMTTSGIKTDAIIEYVDLYPTLLDLTGIPIPDYLEGTSFKPVIEKPDIAWKKAAFSQYPRNNARIEGYSIRTRDFRYTEWRDEVNNGEILYMELYDNREHLLESTNLAYDPQFSEKLKEHMKILRDGWKAALPPGVVNLSDNPPGYSHSSEIETND
jgi:iduronate 2-sulfatase